MDRLSDLLGHAVQFSYTAWDRIVLNGYLDRLQRPENISYFFREVVGVPAVTPEVLMSRTAPYRAWVARYAAEHAIPLVAAPKDQRKEDVVAGYYRQFKAAEGVVAILTSTESGRTFVSYAPRYPPSGGDPGYRLLHPARKRFLHYYFYLLDPVLGPMSLRVGTFLPFTLAVFLNGHSFLAQELTRLGVDFRKDDNAFLAVDDLAALEAAGTRLTPRLIEQRCGSWARQLAPRCSAEERAAVNLRYRYSVAQIELATDVIFRRSAPLKALFRRATELGILLGGADRTTHLFGRRITARYGGKLQTVLDRRNEGQPILRSYYGSSFVKQYEKGDRLLRTETCLNNTYDLGIGRHLDNLPTLRERMLATNTRYLDAQAEVLASTVDGGALASLARPVLVGARRVPGLKLEDDRVIRLLEGLLHPGTFVADWTTREVHARLLARHRLTEGDYRPGQLRYDLGKLRAHGLVERRGTSRRYRLTPRGLKLGVLLVKLRTRLLGPLASLATDEQPRRSTRHPSDLEAAFRPVDTALDHLCDTLGLNFAA
jgi:DNA-binding transcriptional ArsR family regulator